MIGPDLKNGSDLRAKEGIKKAKEEYDALHEYFIKQGELSNLMEKLDLPIGEKTKITNVLQKAVGLPEIGHYKRGDTPDIDLGKIKIPDSTYQRKIDEIFFDLRGRFKESEAALIKKEAKEKIRVKSQIKKKKTWFKKISSFNRIKSKFGEYVNFQAWWWFPLLGTSPLIKEETTITPFKIEAVLPIEKIVPNIQGILDKYFLILDPLECNMLYQLAEFSKHSRKLRNYIPDHSRLLIDEVMPKLEDAAREYVKLNFDERYMKAAFSAIEKLPEDTEAEKMMKSGIMKNLERASNEKNLERILACYSVDEAELMTANKLKKAMTSKYGADYFKVDDNKVQFEGKAKSFFEGDSWKKLKDAMKKERKDRVVRQKYVDMGNSLFKTLFSIKGYEEKRKKPLENLYNKIHLLKSDFLQMIDISGNGVGSGLVNDGKINGKVNELKECSSELYKESILRLPREDQHIDTYLIYITNAPEKSLSENEVKARETIGKIGLAAYDLFELLSNELCKGYISNEFYYQQGRLSLGGKGDGKTTPGSVILYDGGAGKKALSGKSTTPEEALYAATSLVAAIAASTRYCMMINDATLEHIEKSEKKAEPWKYNQEWMHDIKNILIGKKTDDRKGNEKSSGSLADELEDYLKKKGSNSS